MHDSRTMRAIQRLGDLRAVSQDVAKGHRTARDAIGERLPFQQLHASRQTISDARPWEGANGLRTGLPSRFTLRRERGGHFPYLRVGKVAAASLLSTRGVVYPQI
jgi:hypothetical protein